jgi:hypothetical protein
MRFSIRWLLALVAAAAVGCMMFFALPDTAAFWSLLLTSMAIPSLSIPVIVYSRDDLRAFAIGVISSFALTPTAFWFLPFLVVTGNPIFFFDERVAGDTNEMRAWKIFFAIILGSAFLTGLASVAIRHLCRRRARLE